MVRPNVPPVTESAKGSVDAAKIKKGAVARGLATRQTAIGKQNVKRQPERVQNKLGNEIYVIQTTCATNLPHRLSVHFQLGLVLCQTPAEQDDNALKGSGVMHKLHVHAGCACSMPHCALRAPVPALRMVVITEADADEDIPMAIAVAPARRSSAPSSNPSVRRDPWPAAAAH